MAGVVVFLFAILVVVDALEGFPLVALTALFGWLVVRERRARRARLLEQREVIERRIRLIEGSQGLGGS